MLAALPSLSISWVDVLVVSLLVVGVLRGRKRGMSQEVLDILKWTVIVGAAGLLYEPGGRWLAGLSAFSLLFSYVFVYVVVALLTFSIFVYVKGRLGEKLLGSDVFGSAEYYLGMAAGAYRYLCLVVVGMAFLNARYYNAAEIADKDKYQDHNFGTKLIPTLPDVQKEVFDRSLSGRAALNCFNVILIRPTAASEKAGSAQNNISRQRDRAIDQILDKR